jgi:Integrase core domain
MRLKSVGDLQSDFDEHFQIWSPSFLLRECDVSYGSVFSKRVAAMGITEVVTASRSPWQNAYVERVIGSIRRECLDHVVICNERHFAASSFVLRRLLPSNEDVSCTPQGLPGPSPHPATQDRKSRGHPAGRRSASSLRTARLLIRTSGRH